MTTKPSHVLRAPDKAGRRACSRRKVAAAPCRYAPGFFLELVRQHDWPPGFEVAMRWREKAQASPEALRQASGFQNAPLGLEGAKAYVAQWLAREAERARR